MKKLLVATCLAAFAFPGAAVSADKLKLALVPKAMNNPFFDLARDGCYKAQDALDVGELVLGLVTAVPSQIEEGIVHSLGH